MRSYSWQTAPKALTRPFHRPAGSRASSAGASSRVVEERIEGRDFALHRLLGELQTRVVELDESLLKNVNEPSDLR